ncbi:transcription initiation factor IIB family protein [Halosimplex pelagicum]|uniref:Transcription initiation factor IIB family protein n=1 Tax=Halosimplex pelagicum TaxID=869886 RepID=A0A7D5PDH9_9EURY|nr:transcription initiation factor IIB family protein [Halosimplex pelagicum]QLH84162.1 transcription initiation factor IIB family protein [Halosimplex pelagicum]
MYSARDQVENSEWLDEVEATAERLDMDEAARSRAADLFLSNVPETDRSKRAVLATSVYVAGLVEGDSRSQQRVAEVADVSRLTISKRYEEMLESQGLDAPRW